MSRPPWWAVIPPALVFATLLALVPNQPPSHAGIGRLPLVPPVLERLWWLVAG
ncbi:MULTISPECIES: hypothetical protein [unclassified Streptomyces]|uniref:hypothetical protein n=1 Tax=unclassified Streptomyces TaxID=2593676 RepID=UPI0019032A34|nr:hypothetical protein [Streptomyces sp. HSG2]